MGNQTNEKQWAAAERLRYIERCAFWRGFVNRSDLQRVYGLSAAQASSDLRRYTELNPRALTYDLTRKRYEGTATMRPKLHAPRLEEAVEMFLGSEMLAAPLSHSHRVDAAHPQIATVNIPQRSASLEAQRAVFQAVLFAQRLRVRYVSFSSRGESWRVIAPHALAHDGYRWHARAWCFENRDFRNFVLGRILRVGHPATPAGHLPVDRTWREWTNLRLLPRRGLSAAQARAIRLEYGMAGAGLKLKVRRAMLDATLMHLRLPPADGRNIPPLLEVGPAKNRRVR